MILSNPQELSGYEAALEGAAFFHIPSGGYLRIGGDDRVDFLQRQSTNDLNLLTPDRAVVTALTNPAARILDVLTVFEEPNSLGAITLPGRALHTYRYLRSRIFFMDKASIDDASDEYDQIDLIGPGIVDLLYRFGVEEAPSPDLVTVVEIANRGMKIIGQPGLGPRLLLPKEGIADVIEKLEREGITSISFETYEILRLEAGLPAADHELTEDFTPLESGMEVAVSTNKGCFTGQEVIARQITYDKVTRHLVGLELESLGKAGDRVWVDGQAGPVGTVTSVGESPRFGPIALAILKRPFNQPGSQVTVGDKNGIRGEVLQLPFHS